MTETDQASPAELDGPGPPFKLEVPNDRVALTVVDEYGEAFAESSWRSCGAGRLRSAIAFDAKRDDDLRVAVTERCYDVPPGATVTLRVSPYSGGRPHAATGTVHLEVSRGRLSATRLELDGSVDHADVTYRAPDETIKVSIRAYLEGHRRGKVHLHLDPPEE